MMTLSEVRAQIQALATPGRFTIAVPAFTGFSHIQIGVIREIGIPIAVGVPAALLPSLSAELAGASKVFSSSSIGRPSVMERQDLVGLPAVLWHKSAGPATVAAVLEYRRRMQPPWMSLRARPDQATRLADALGFELHIIGAQSVPLRETMSIA